MSSLRAAVIGCGFMGRMHGSVYKALPTAEVVACLDISEERARKYAGEFGIEPFTDFDTMIQATSPDIVSICLPTYLHKDFTIRAAEAGRHVICEKPMALSLEEADAMTAACSRAGVYFMIGHCIRFWPEYAMLKDVSDSGRLGQLLSLNLTRLGEFPSWSADNWMADENLAGGGVLDMHIHDTDYALYLLGKPDEVVSYGTVDSHGPSFAFTTLVYPRCVAHLEGGWNLPNHTPFRMTFRAIFEGGAVFMENGPMTIYQNGREPIVPEFKKMEAQGGGNLSDLGGYYLELEYFVDHIRSGRPLEVVTPQTSRESLAVVLDEIAQIKSRAQRGLFSGMASSTRT